MLDYGARVASLIRYKSKRYNYRYCMELHNIRGGTKEALFSKQYNIGIGISLGNKWFTPENILEQTQWALQFTKEYVIVYVADSIHAINLEVRNDISYEKSLQTALKRGEKMLETVKKLLERTLTKDDLAKIKFAQWDDLKNVKFLEKTTYLKTLYETNDKFRNTIHNIIRNYTVREKKSFSESQIHRLGMYVIEELPELISRTPIKELTFEAWVYPFDGELTKFVDDIQKEIVFPEIKDAVLDTEPKVFLEVR